MGKIVKYCNGCDESFAEKFGFCPICGEALNAFEMNPIKEAAPPLGQPEVAPTAGPETELIGLVSTSDDLPVAENLVTSVETQSFFDESPTTDGFLESEIELDLGANLESTNESFRAAGTTAGSMSQIGTDGFETEVVYDDFLHSEAGQSFGADFGYDFKVTVLAEKNVKQRNLLLLGSMFLMVSLSVGVVIGSIFNHPLLVGAIGEDDLVAFVPIVDEAPMTVEEEKQKANDKDAGGGGGGGRDEETPTSEGRLATQTENPLISPTKTIPQKDFELQQPIASTQGTKEAEQTEQPYGDPNSKYTSLSDGRGTGGGQGSGEGTGQGSGRGTGQGSGTGSGSGSGLGDGNGDGTGSGTSGGDRNPQVATSGPTKKVTFISKPQPRYTDAARINNIQGNVTLRITFLSNGQIGGISPVKGLPHGLTEQAIAAARQIRFQPALRNGQPQSVTMSVQYTFTIY